MRLLRQNKIHNEGKMTGVRRGVIYTLAAFMFCLVLSIGTVCYADEVPATVTVESAKIRASADPNSQQLGSAKQGGTVSIIGQTTGTDGKTWYQVFVDANTKGFIRADLVKVTGDGTIGSVSSDAAASAASTDSNTASATAADTKVTAVDAKTGTVQTNNVRIRKGASTNADVVATANRGMVVTVTGEAAGNDGKTWYQVSFTYNSKEITGFIRSDLVTFDALPAETAQSTITGTSETEGTPAETEETAQETGSEETAPEEQTQEQSESSGDGSENIILLNVDEIPYIMPEFTPIILKWEGQDINAFKNGDFYIFYAQKQNGEEGWYVFDSANGVYQRYVYGTSGATVPEESSFSGSLLPVIILVVIIVILLAVIGLMFMKLREYTGEYDEYDDEEDEEEEYVEEETEEEEESYEEPVRHPQPRRQPSQPPVRPRQGQARREEQPGPAQQPGRPAGQGQQPRRPQQGQQVRHPEGEVPVRRQPGPNRESGQTNRPVNRPAQPQANVERRPAGQGQQHRPPQSQRPVQPRPQQQGRKAKNFLEAEDDDMEFIDI